MRNQMIKFVKSIFNVALILMLNPIRVSASENLPSNETGEIMDILNDIHAIDDLSPKEGNPYTKDEIKDLILPVEKWDSAKVISSANLREGYQAILVQGKQRAQANQNNLNEEEMAQLIPGDPTDVFESEKGKIYTYISVEDDLVQVLRVQLDMNDARPILEMANIEYQYKSANQFERLDTSIEELNALYETKDLESFVHRFDVPQIVTTTFYNGYLTESYIWSVVANDAVTEEEVTALEVYLEDGILKDVTYYRNGDQETESQGTSIGASIEKPMED